MYYDHPRDRMIFPDYMNGTIASVDLKTGVVSRAVVGNGTIKSTFMIQLKDNSDLFLISDGLRMRIIEWNCKDECATIVGDPPFSLETDPIYSQNLMDVAKATPQCGFIGGTYRCNICGNEPTANAAAYTYSEACGVKPFIEDIKVSGGIEFTNDNLAYHVSSCENVVREYDYDPETQQLCMCF